MSLKMKATGLVAGTVLVMAGYFIITLPVVGGSPEPAPKIDRAPAVDDRTTHYTFSATWHPEGRRITINTTVGSVTETTDQHYAPFDRDVYVRPGTRLMMSVYQGDDYGVVGCTILRNDVTVVPPNTRTTAGSVRCETVST